MSYQKKLTKFKKGEQLSTCGKYNLEDLDDMFCETQFSNNDDYCLEDVLTFESGKGFTLSENVTVKEMFYDEDDHAMFIELTDYGTDEYVKVECSLEQDLEWHNEFSY